MGYTMGDLIVNGQRLHADGFRVDIGHILISNNFAAIFHKLRGKCGWKVTVIKYIDGAVNVEGTLDEGVPEYIYNAEDSEITWQIVNDTLYCLSQWDTGRRLWCQLLQLKPENGCIKPTGIWKEDIEHCPSFSDNDYDSNHANAEIGSKFYCQIKNHGFRIKRVT